MKTCFALSLGFISCIYSRWDDFEHGLIVGGQRPELLMNVNFEPIIIGLKSDIFDWDWPLAMFLLGSLSIESQCQEITFLWSQASSQYNFRWNILRTCDGQILYYHQSHRTAFNSTFHRKTIGKLFAFSSSHIYLQPSIYAVGNRYQYWAHNIRAPTMCIHDKKRRDSLSIGHFISLWSLNF